MGFTWTQPISAGSLASMAALKEIRDNLDYIDNNLACITHNSSYCSTTDSTINASYYYAQDSTAKGTIYSYNDGSIYRGANYGVTCMTYYLG